MMGADDVFHEAVTLRMAFGDLVHHVCRRPADVDAVPLDEVLAGLDDFGIERFAAMLLAYKHVDSMEAGRVLAFEVERWVQEGRRPRGLPELLGSAEAAAVERAFMRGMTASQPWWKRLWERAARALIADDERSARLDDAELRREGRRP